MNNLKYQVNINAPATRVYDVMLGITDKSTYKQWTAIFNPTSSYEGSWDKGSKILFVGVDEKGKRGGMISRIADNVPNQRVSIQYYGIIKGDEEITEGPEVEQLTDGFENYTFEEDDGTTTVTIELITSFDFTDYMDQTYPKALVKLKEICEK